MTICTEIKEVDDSNSSDSSPGVKEGNIGGQVNKDDKLDFKIEHKLPHVPHIYDSFE